MSYLVTWQRRINVILTWNKNCLPLPACVSLWFFAVHWSSEWWKHIRVSLDSEFIAVWMYESHEAFSCYLGIRFEWRNEILPGRIKKGKLKFHLGLITLFVEYILLPLILYFNRRNLACACNIVFPCLVVWYVILDNMTYVYVYGILLSLTNLLLSLKPREDAANAVTGIEEFLINVDKKNSEAGSASPTQKSCDDDVTIDDEEKRVRFQFIWIFRVYIVNVVMYVCVELCNLLITTEKKNIFISLFFTDNRQQWNNTNFHWLS